MEKPKNRKPRTAQGWVLRWSRVVEDHLRDFWGEPSHPLDWVPSRIPEEPHRKMGVYKVWTLESRVGIVRIKLPRWSRAMVPGPVGCLAIEFEEPDRVPDDLKKKHHMPKGKLHIRDPWYDQVNPDLAADGVGGFLLRFLGPDGLNAIRMNKNEDSQGS